MGRLSLSLLLLTIAGCFRGNTQSSTPVDEERNSAQGNIALQDLPLDQLFVDEGDPNQEFRIRYSTQSLESRNAVWSRLAKNLTEYWLVNDPASEYCDMTEISSVYEQRGIDRISSYFNLSEDDHGQCTHERRLPPGIPCHTMTMYLPQFVSCRDSNDMESIECQGYLSGELGARFYCGNAPEPISIYWASRNRQPYGELEVLQGNLETQFRVRYSQEREEDVQQILPSLAQSFAEYWIDHSREASSCNIGDITGVLNFAFFTSEESYTRNYYNSFAIQTTGSDNIYVRLPRSTRCFRSIQFHETWTERQFMCGGDLTGDLGAVIACH